MAIQVSGTNIITDAKALNGITSIDSTTASAISSGGVGAPTTYNSVGSYVFACHPSSRLSGGDTASGSTLRACAFTSFSTPGSNGSANVGIESSSSLSGTWRCMGQHGLIGNSSPYYINTYSTFVRIS